MRHLSLPNSNTPSAVLCAQRIDCPVFHRRTYSLAFFSPIFSFLGSVFLPAKKKPIHQSGTALSATPEFRGIALQTAPIILVAWIHNNIFAIPYAIAVT
jgi:hypothetical protein